MPPEALRDGLLSIADRLALPLEGSAVDRLLAYLDLLQRWNQAYNLTSVREPGAMLTQHLADCLAVILPLRRHLAARPVTRLLDVGAGAGLPGVVIAALQPELSVTCVDAVGKKVAFVRQVAGELRLPNLQAEHVRVEKWKPAPFELITSRAFASLADFSGWTGHLLASGGAWMAMKGRRPDDEIAALPAAVEVFHVEPLDVPDLGAERCLVWMQAAAHPDSRMV